MWDAASPAFQITTAHNLAFGYAASGIAEAMPTPRLCRLEKGFCCGARNCG